MATMTRTISATGHGLGPAGGRRRADHRSGRPGDLVRAQPSWPRVSPWAGV
ncbi:MAG: hypothetical protein MZV70_56700 [Desulfobacterales bacterium]|nr:hypothetical protein [Desulfobacterales bacterium]